mmetsp:Transcript_16099/g.46960  ORF Transcript_16099/g.46960 Transcript_16099/m.46960 type:complete len:221 (+) Transcript_16099:48-710(+)
MIMNSIPSHEASAYTAQPAPLACTHVSGCSQLQRSSPFTTGRVKSMHMTSSKPAARSCRTHESTSRSTEMPSRDASIPDHTKTLGRWGCRGPRTSATTSAPPGLSAANAAPRSASRAPKAYEASTPTTASMDPRATTWGRSPESEACTTSMARSTLTVAAAAATSTAPTLIPTTRAALKACDRQRSRLSPRPQPMSSTWASAPTRARRPLWWASMRAAWL